MTGFDRKVLHLFHESEAAVEVTIEVDFLGTACGRSTRR